MGVEHKLFEEAIHRKKESRKIKLDTDLSAQDLKELVNDYMSRDPSTASRAVPLLLIARHLERICDHATNIAEDIVYMVEAKVVRHHPEELG